MSIPRATVSVAIVSKRGIGLYENALSEAHVGFSVDHRNAIAQRTFGRCLVRALRLRRRPLKPRGILNFHLPFDPIRHSVLIILNESVITVNDPSTKVKEDRPFIATRIRL
jgi:hypothetical protein